MRFHQLESRHVQYNIYIHIQVCDKPLEAPYSLSSRARELRGGYLCANNATLEALCVAAPKGPWPLKVLYCIAYTYGKAINPSHGTQVAAVTETRYQFGCCC